MYFREWLASAIELEFEQGAVISSIISLNASCFLPMIIIIVIIFICIIFLIFINIIFIILYSDCDCY